MPVTPLWRQYVEVIKVIDHARRLADAADEAIDRRSAR